MITGTWQTLLLSLEGRIPRQDYWVATIAFFALVLVASLISTTLGIIALLAILYPSVCVAGKRWHDRDKSAWWILIGAIPLIGGLWALIECGILPGTPGPNRYGNPPA